MPSTPLRAWTFWEGVLGSSIKLDPKGSSIFSNPRGSKASNNQYLTETKSIIPCTETQSPPHFGTWTHNVENSQVCSSSKTSSGPSMSSLHGRGRKHGQTTGVAVIMISEGGFQGRSYPGHLSTEHIWHSPRAFLHVVLGAF